MSDAADLRITIRGEMSADAWMLVEGGPLSRPIEVKLRLAGPEQPVIVGLRLDDGSPVTSRDLRLIRLPEVARAVLAAVQDTALSLEESSAEARQRLIEAYGHDEQSARLVNPFVPDWSDEHAAAAQWAEDGAAAMELRDWLSELKDAKGELETRPRGRGASAPTTVELREFARIYLEERLDGRASLVSRAARRTHMSRPTAYRWLAACRDAGYLPTEDQQ